MNSMTPGRNQRKPGTVDPCAGSSDQRPLRKRKRRLLAAEEGARNPTSLSPELLGLTGGELSEGLDSWLADMDAELGRVLGFQPDPTPPPATCGARTRKGSPCRGLALANRRCKNHGGLSTGPKTDPGRARRLAGYKLWLGNKRRLAGALAGDPGHFAPAVTE